MRIRNKKQDDAGMTTVTVRLPSLMTEKLDNFVEERLRRNMGAPYTRSDAIRDAAREMLERWVPKTGVS